MTNDRRWIAPVLGGILFVGLLSVSFVDWSDETGVISRPQIIAIDAELSGLRRTETIVDEEYGEVEREVFWRMRQPVKILDRFDLGENKGTIAAYYLEGEPLRVDRVQQFVIQQGGGAGSTLRTHMIIDYEDRRFLAGWKSVNDEPTEPDEHEIRASYRYAQDVYEDVLGSEGLR